MFQDVVVVFLPLNDSSIVQISDLEVSVNYTYIDWYYLHKSCQLRVSLYYSYSLNPCHENLASHKTVCSQTQLFYRINII